MVTVRDGNARLLMHRTLCAPQVLEKEGPEGVDVVINNAGAAMRGPIVVSVQAPLHCNPPFGQDPCASVQARARGHIVGQTVDSPVDSLAPTLPTRCTGHPH